MNKSSIILKKDKKGRMRYEIVTMIDPNQIQSTHYKANTLTIYFYPLPGNPWYHEYYLTHGEWRKQPSMKKVDDYTHTVLDIILLHRKNKKEMIRCLNELVPCGTTATK